MQHSRIQTASESLTFELLHNFLPKDEIWKTDSRSARPQKFWKTSVHWYWYTFHLLLIT